MPHSRFLLFMHYKDFAATDAIGWHAFMAADDNLVALHQIALRVLHRLTSYHIVDIVELSIIYDSTTDARL